MDAGTQRMSLPWQMGKDIAFYLMAKKQQLTIHDPPNEYAAAMRKLVDDLIEMYEDEFQRIIRESDLDNSEGLQAIIDMFDEMLRDGQITWGRIGMLYAFSGYIATRCSGTDRNSLEVIATLGGFVGFYTEDNLHKWIEEQGGWCSFLKWVNGPREERSSWNFLSNMWMLGVAGGALILGIAAIKVKDLRAIFHQLI